MKLESVVGSENEGTRYCNRTTKPSRHTRVQLWYFGMKAHIGADAESGLVHTVRGTSGHVSDIVEGNTLLHGQEAIAFGDAGYQGIEKRPDAKRGVTWHIAMRPGKRKALDKDNEAEAMIDKAEKLKAGIRAKVEHPFRVIKRQFGFVKVRYRGLKKNIAQLFSKQWDGRSHLNGIEVCQSGDANQPLKQTGASDMKVTTVGIDLAKNVFQLHGVNEFGKTVIKKQLRRDQVSEYFVNLPACLIGMEACGSAHYWARKLQGFGHTVKLMAPQFVKPYVKTNKNDAADAEAICEAVARPNMRFVPIKNVEQQAVLALHRVRQGFVKARTAQANQIRGLLGEFGLIIPQGIGYIATRVPELIEDASNELPGSFRILVQRLLDRLLTPPLAPRAQM